MTLQLPSARRRGIGGCAADGSWLLTVGAAKAGERALATAGGRSLVLQEGRPGRACSSRSERCAVVFDGELHDRQSLRAELGVAADLPDSELVRLAFELWGEECASRLRGDYAFCLLDLTSGAVVAVRDRVGNYPLYYLEAGEEIHFSTSADAFAGLPGAGLERQALLLHVLDRVPLERTLRNGVVRLQPGHLVRFEAGVARVRPYWELPAVGEGAEWVRSDELAEFEVLLREVVSRAFDGGPVGVLLSGGLDSAAVAIAAVDVARERRFAPPQALSLHMPGGLDERETQRAVARRLGMPQVVVEACREGIERLADDALALSASRSLPLQNIWLPATERLVCLAFERGCRVLIGGSGGDEWLGVNPIVAADQLRSFDLAGVVRTCVSLLRSSHLQWHLALRQVLWRSALRPLVTDQLPGRAADTGAGAPRLPGWVAPDPLLRSEVELQLGLQRRSRRMVGSRYFEQVQRTIQHPRTVADREESFESARHLGVRFSATFWDPRLIEFLYRVPPHLLEQGGRSKSMVRRPVARRLPGLGFEHQRKLEWTGESILPPALRHAWRRLGGATALADTGVIDGARFAAHVEDAIARGDGRGLTSAWRTLCLESWVRPRV